MSTTLVSARPKGALRTAFAYRQNVHRHIKLDAIAQQPIAQPKHRTERYEERVQHIEFVRIAQAGDGAQSPADCRTATAAAVVQRGAAAEYRLHQLRKEQLQIFLAATVDEQPEFGTSMHDGHVQQLVEVQLFGWASR